MNFRKNSMLPDACLFARVLCVFALSRLFAFSRERGVVLLPTLTFRFLLPGLNIGISHRQTLKIAFRKGLNFGFFKDFFSLIND